MRKLLLPGILVALPVAALIAAACGGDDDTKADTGTAGATATTAATPGNSAMDQAMAHMEEMVAAAQASDLEGAATHLELADEFLHEVIDDLEKTDTALAADLEEAVEDAENDIESGEEAEHIVEIGEEIIDLLEQVH